MRVRRPCFLPVLLAVVVWGTAGDAVAAGPASQADRALDRALRQLVAAEDGPPGAIAVIQRGDRRVAHSAGVANIEQNGRIRPWRQMRIASVAKAFSGAVALSLVDDGVLALGDTIGSRLPDLPGAWHRITLGQLLSHTSGLPDFTASRAFAEAVTASPAAGPPPRELLSYVAADPLEFPPGSAYRYSNTDNIVVGLMAEAATGERYEAVLRARVLDPLRLRKTFMPLGTGLPAAYVHGYARGRGGELEDVSQEVAFGNWAWASGGIVSSPDDLTDFVRGYVGGKLFGGASRRSQYRFRQGTSEPPGPGHNAAGPALFRYRTRCGTVFGHTGSILGYTQLIAATRDGRRSVTFTINEQFTDELLPRLRRAQVAAVCAALAGR